MKAPQVDESRGAHEFVTADQHLVLAIPTTDFQSGETIKSFTVFSFNPDKNDLGDYKSWQYLGSVAAGGDNSANCGDDLPQPCVASSGRLSFVAPASGTMPVIRMVMSGTEVAAAGKARALDAKHAVDYTFDAETRQYQPAGGN